MNDEQRNLKAKQPHSPRKISAFGVFGLIILIFCGIGLISAMIASGTDENGKQTQERSVSNSVPKSAIGQTISEDGFNFVVNSIKCGEARISTNGDVYFYSDAQGQFCRLNVTVTNTGNTANSIDASAQYLFNPQGQRYTYDSSATSHAANYSLGSPLNDDINPGNSITGDFVFDVPTDVTLATAELHARSGSKGMVVSLQ